MTVEMDNSSARTAFSSRSDNDGRNDFTSGKSASRSFVSYLPAAGQNDRAKSFSEQGLFVETDDYGKAEQADIFSQDGITAGKTSVRVGPEPVAQSSAPLPVMTIASRSIPQKFQFTIDVRPAHVPLRADKSSPVSAVMPQESKALTAAQPGHLPKTAQPDISKNAHVKPASSDLSGARALAAILLEREARNAAIPIRIAVQDMKNGMEIIAKVTDADEAERKKMGAAVKRLLAEHGITDFNFKLNGKTPAA